MSNQDLAQLLPVLEAIPNGQVSRPNLPVNWPGEAGAPPQHPVKRAQNPV